MKRLISSFLLGGALTTLWAVPAGASCASPPPLPESLAAARTAFVGTVVATSNGARDAEVQVQKIWLGERLPARVGVEGGAQGSGVASSTDPRWEPGRRYLFVLEDATPPFSDNACSGTTQYNEEVAALEPEGAVGPLEGSAGTFSPWLAIGLVLLALGVGQARRAGRRAHTIEI